MTQIETRQLAEQVYELLLQEILRGTLQPGERILDQELAAELGISRTPVKDAINRLAMEGLLDIHPRRGTFVVEPDPESFNELVDVRLMMELHAVKNLPHKDSATAIEKMEHAIRAIDEMLERESYRDIAAYMALDGDFHRALVAGVGNSRLSWLYRSIAIHNQIGRIRYPHDSFMIAQQEHREMLDAYRQHSQDRLALLLIKHVERSRRQVLGVLHVDSED